VTSTERGGDVNVNVNVQQGASTFTTTFAFTFCLALVLAACHHADGPPPPLPRAAYAHYLAGKLALYGGDPKQAATELVAAAGAAPDQPMIAVEEARALAKAGRESEARSVLVTARAKWPSHAEVWLASGELLEKSARDEAAHAYRRTIELSHEDERAYLGLARVQLASGQAKDAEQTLRGLVGQVPTSVEGRFRLAQRLLDRGDRTHAVAELRRVLERDPDQIDARLDLARALRADGNLTEAIAQTRSAFDRAGEPMDVAEELFWLLCEADDLRGAIDLLTLLDDDRSDADGLMVVARLELGLGRIDVATTIVGKLVGMRSDAVVLVQLEIDLARHDFAALDGHVAAVPPTSPLLGDVQRLAAEAAFYRGDAERALATLQTVPSIHDADLVVARARAKEIAGDTSAALAIIEPVARDHPDEPVALNLAGYLLADTHTRLADAERYLRRARELSPGDPAVLDSWGWLLLAQGRAQDAVLALAKAARLSPLEPEILVHLATAQLAARSPSSTVAATLDRAAALRPSPAVERKIAAVRGKLGTS
jgi:tetratricopeptide (TPR) repeat protein